MDGVELLEQSLADLRKQVDAHGRAMRALVLAQPESMQLRCEVTECRHRQVLRATLLSAIEVLEATRKAFRSKQLEALKREFLRVLREETETHS